MYLAKNREGIKKKIPREIGVKMTYGRFAVAIAASCACLGLQLITTDKDYDHLQNEFLERSYFSPESFKK